MKKKEFSFPAAQKTANGIGFRERGPGGLLVLVLGLKTSFGYLLIIQQEMFLFCHLLA